MSVVFKIIGGSLALTSTFSGLYNFKFDQVAGAAAVGQVLFFVCAEAIWRTRVAQKSMEGKVNKNVVSSNSSENNNNNNKKKSNTYDIMTSFLCGATLATSAITSNILCWKNKGAKESPLWSKIVAGVGMVSAFFIRRAAMLTLKDKFTMALATVDDHQVCDTGIYAYVRHSGYLANLLLMTSYAHLVSGNWKMTLASAVSFFVCWGIIRIPLEEKMLEASLGTEYTDYKAKVRAKLIPFVY